jgi:hypothetical protein
MFQYLPSPVAKEIRHSVSNVTPRIVMKDDGVRCQQVSSLSPECWTKVVLQEIAVVGSIYHLPLRYSMVQYYPMDVICHSEHHLHTTFCRAYLLWMRRAGMLPFTRLPLQVWFVRAIPGFVHSDDPSKEVVTFPLVAVQQVLCNSIMVPLSHLSNFMGYPTRNFAVSKNVVQNVEHGFVAYAYLCS